MSSTELMGDLVAERIAALVTEAKSDESIRRGFIGVAARMLPRITTEAERQLYAFMPGLQALAAELEAGPAGGFSEEAAAEAMALVSCAEDRRDALLACLPILVNLPTKEEQIRHRFAGPFISLLAALSQHQYPIEEA